MMLTDAEASQIRKSIEEQAGLEEELVRRCEDMMHLGMFDEAVRSAFVLLEERLKKAVNQEGVTGTQLANYAFNPASGPLAKHLGHDQSEREGLRELYSGAFKLFRNPTAHGVVNYSAAEGKAIIGLVDLLLKMLKRAGELPPPGMFPEKLERVLGTCEEVIGAGATTRLRIFLGKSLKDLGLEPSVDAEQWIPFRRHCLYKLAHWEKPRSHPIAVFYLVATAKQYGISFPIAYYYSGVVGFNVERLIEELKDLGFGLSGKSQEPFVDLKKRNDQAFFDTLFDLVTRTVDELEGTLQ